MTAALGSGERAFDDDALTSLGAYASKTADDHAKPPRPEISGRQQRVLGGPTPAAGQPDSQLDSRPDSQPSACLPMLDYYLTFIHYFGFSINPNDDTNSRYLSLRVKRAAAFASSIRLHRRNQRLRARATNSELAHCEYDREAEGHDDNDKEERDYAKADELDADGEESEPERGGESRASLASVQGQPRPPERRGGGRGPCRRANRAPSGPRCWKRVRLTIKFTAIGLTSFLALNHLVVLIDYVRQGSKVLTELMLEMRLVITKLSALIFVFSWHRNQARVRQLIRLVRSTSANILAHEGAGGGGEQSQAHCPRLQALNRRVLVWWLLCASITFVHFSLSEAEIKTAHHLWEWLDDYSLHTLSNATTSTASLFAMASFDNYIYTVHVYGTRLIGASVICIVCTLQVESINCLTRHALGLLQASQVAQIGGASNMQTTTASSPAGQVQGSCARRAPASQNHESANPTTWCWSWWWPTVWESLDSVLGAGSAADRSRLAVARKPPHPSRLVGWQQQRQLCRSFYVLGESSWLQVERERRQLAPPGWLSGALAQLAGAVRRLACACVSPLSSLGANLRSLLGRPSGALKNRVTPFSVWARLFSARQQTHRQAPGAAAAGSPRATIDAADLELEQADRSLGANHAPHNHSPPPARASPGFLRARNADNSNSHERAAPLLRRYFNDYLARECRMREASLHHHHHQQQQQQQYQRGRRRPPRLRSTSGARYESHATQDNGDARPQTEFPSGQEVELQLDNLARKYELVRTVNLRIDHCFGHILLSQYLFLFLMSCIDVVFFSLSFSTNTKTKYIIVSGMILLWLPYLLLYRYASDIGLASERLLTSVRRLARLALVLQLSASEARAAGRVGAQGPPAAAAAGGRKRAQEEEQVEEQRRRQQQQQQQYGEVALGRRDLDGALFWPGSSALWHYRYLLCRRAAAIAGPAGSPLVINRPAGAAQAMAAAACGTARAHANPQPANAANTARHGDRRGADQDEQQRPATGCSSRARILNKLDHVFKSSHLSIVGVMTLNKFFLLDFAKIVITASVMTIQFITRR